MMQKSTEITTTYDMGDGYRVDIVELKDELEAWIYETTNGVKILMFGVDKSIGMDSFLDMVESQFDEYKSDYIDEYVDGQESDYHPEPEFYIS